MVVRMTYRIRQRSLKWFVDCFDETGAWTATLGPYNHISEAEYEAGKTGYQDGDKQK